MPAGYPTVKKATSRQKNLNRIAKRTQQTLLPLVAVGGSFATIPVDAIELGHLEARDAPDIAQGLARAQIQAERRRRSTVAITERAARRENRRLHLLERDRIRGRLHAAGSVFPAAAGDGEEHDDRELSHAFQIPQRPFRVRRRGMSAQ